MTLVAWICAVLLGITGLLCLLAIVRGPTTLDRAIASDVFLAGIVAAIAVEAAVGQHTNSLPLLVALSFIAFMSSTSIARYVRDDRSDGAIEEESE